MVLQLVDDVIHPR